MSDMIHAVVSLVLLACFTTVTLGRLMCGIELVTSNVMEVNVKLYCVGSLAQHQACCLEHGVCYMMRQQLERCDNQYCKCLADIRDMDQGCKALADSFCNLIKGNGHLVYPVFTKEIIKALTAS